MEINENKQEDEIYVGQYQDDKKQIRHGKGKIYYPNPYKTLKFDGEFKSGKKEGKGSEYENGLKTFDGNYTNDKKNGEGKEYNKKGELMFEGNFIDDEKNGEGKEYIEGILRFEGNYTNGKRNGQGKEYDEKGKTTFEGNYAKGKKNGSGKEYNDKMKIIYEGQYSNGEKNGKGESFDPENNKRFRGEFREGQKNKGIELYKKIIDNNNYIKYKSEYENGEMKNVVKMWQYKEGKVIFIGESLNGEKNGNGKEYDNKGHLLFEGKYINGEKNGNGIEYNPDGKFVGEYINGKKWNGKGINKKGDILYDIINGYGTIREYEDGNLIYEGGYLNGMRHGEGREYTKDKIIKVRYSYGLKFED